jgi:hypothetical protein
MSRARCARVLSVVLGLAVVGSVIPGCGGNEAPPPMKEEDMPSSKGKDSMNYFRQNMMKQGTKKK